MEKGLWVDHSSFLIARILVGETPQSASREVSSLHPVVPLDSLNLLSTVEWIDEIDHIHADLGVLLIHSVPRPPVSEDSRKISPFPMVQSASSISYAV
jgi:hypothetical protein